MIVRVVEMISWEGARLIGYGRNEIDSHVFGKKKKKVGWQAFKSKTWLGGNGFLWTGSVRIERR